jgi:hypothetical protein
MRWSLSLGSMRNEAYRLFCRLRICHGIWAMDKLAFACCICLRHWTILSMAQQKQGEHSVSATHSFSQMPES